MKDSRSPQRVPEGTDKAQARKALMESKVYRMLAIMTFVIAIAAFVFIYITKAQGSIVELIKSPELLVFLVIPIIPAFLMMNKALRAEAQLKKLLGLEDV